MTAEAPARRRVRPGELDDVTLRRAQAGDPAAFRALVERYQRPIWELCWRMAAPVGLADRADDLTQDAFVRVYRALPEFDPRGPARLSTWIFTIAARLTLAARYQDKYLAAHEAVIGVASRLTAPRVRELIAGAGIDMDRLDKDLAANAQAIDAVLKRNNDQAVAFEFRGTPSFIVGKYRVPGSLTMKEFERVIADARKAKMGR